MGLDYEFRLSFSADRRADAVRGLAARAWRPPDDRDGAVLWFPEDEAIRRFMADRPTIAREAGRVAIGAVYVRARELPDEFRLDLTPASSAMSILFTRSDAIRRTLEGLLAENGGLLGLLHDSDENWGPVVFWPESHPEHVAGSLFEVHRRVAPNTAYYHRHDLP